MLQRATSFRAEISRRRTVRHFSSRPVDSRVIEQCLLAAGTAPSGANLQPWRFVAITSPNIKRRLRVALDSPNNDGFALDVALLRPEFRSICFDVRQF
ncbi:MAG: nitroreductase family protein [Casimicrobiaceae bacterium]